MRVYDAVHGVHRILYGNNCQLALKRGTILWSNPLFRHQLASPQISRTGGPNFEGIESFELRPLGM